MQRKITAVGDKSNEILGGETVEVQKDPREPSGLGVSRRQVLKGAGLVLGASGVLAALGAPTTVLAAEGEKSLAGAWLVTVTAPILGVFQSLFTCDPGGGLVLTGSIDSAPGLKSSPVHGAWAHESGRIFRWHGLAFAFDDAGNLNGIFDIKETLTLNEAGIHFSGPGTFEIKPAGTNPITVPPTSYTVSAVRIKA